MWEPKFTLNVSWTTQPAEELSIQSSVKQIEITHITCFSKTVIGDSSELPKWFISQMQWISSGFCHFFGLWGFYMLWIMLAGGWTLCKCKNFKPTKYAGCSNYMAIWWWWHPLCPLCPLHQLHPLHPLVWLFCTKENIPTTTHHHPTAPTVSTTCPTFPA